MKNKQVANVAIISGITIFGIKLLAYLVSNSVAFLSDALESIVNIVASGLMLFSLYVSEKPADDSHNYGHQKIEQISSLLEGLLIISAAILIIYSALGRIFEPANLLELNLAIAISILATTLNGVLSLFLSRAAKESGSAALEGDSMHLKSDVISSIGVWIGLFVVQLTGWNPMDSILAIAIAVLIARIGIGLILKSSQGLMDQSCKEEEEKIKEVFFLHKSRFTNFHDVKTRRHGNQILAELHLSVDGSLSVEEAHKLADHLEEELNNELPNITLTIHIEPTK